MVTVEATSLTAETRSEITLGLQRTLSELIDLALQGKHAHWNVVGSLFRSLHLQLDEIVDSLRTWSDDVAERMLALDETADGRPAAILATANPEPFPEGYLQDETVIDIMSERLESQSGKLRVRMSEIEAIDPVTFDLLQGIVYGLEKHRWMLKAHARTGR